MTLWQRLLAFVRRLFEPKQLFLVFWFGMSDDTDRTVNNARLQALALDAAKSAAELGLKGAEARSAALARLKSALSEIGIELADRAIDTLLQVAYYKFRQQEG